MVGIHDVKNFEIIQNNMVLRFVFRRIKGMSVLPIYGTTLVLKICSNEGKV